MSVFLDTGVIYAEYDSDASRHASASRALEAIYDGEFGHPYVSDYVFDEVLTLTRRRTGSYADAVEVGRRLRGEDGYPLVFELVHVTPTVFTNAIETFERYDDQSLSFTDATTIALIDRHGIDSLVSFDEDFDGMVDRIEPGTLA